jgi:tetratricopeptide (TPR) repeat protein
VVSDGASYWLRARRLADELADGALARLTPLIEDKGLARNVRFAALYVLLVRLFRDMDYRRYREQFDRWAPEFRADPRFPLLRAEYCLAQGHDGLGNALRLSREALARLPEDPAALHQYAFVVAELEEATDEPSDSRRRRRIDDALEAVERASDDVPDHPIFHATRARLLALAAEFHAARQAIQQAVECEPKESPHHATRLAEYQDIRAAIGWREKMESFERRQEQAARQLEDMRGQGIELVGLLAVVIAFFVTSVEIAKGFQPREAERLIAVAGGVIVVVFASFSVLYRADRLRRATLITAAMVAALGVIGIVLAERLLG